MTVENFTSLNHLKWSLQALALQPEQQVQLFPSFVWVGDELAVDFDERLRVALEDHQFTPDQRSALTAVDTILARMTAEENMDLWEDGTALSRYPQWQEVRESARQALEQFGWSLEVPPKDRAIYVGPPDDEQRAELTSKTAVRETMRGSAISPIRAREFREFVLSVLIFVGALVAVAIFLTVRFGLSQ
jgi:hypothetical protein